MAGYSGTPLPQKLGIKPGHVLLLLDPPDGLVTKLGPLPNVELVASLRGEALLDVVVCFVTSRSALEKRFGAVTQRLRPEGGLWIAWPKKASKVPTDMTEDVVRAVALPAGYVDNKVCAIDEVWSGLRVVKRRELR